MPTTPWDTVFGGIASWLGIRENDLDKVCPNLYNFDSSYLLDPEDMFDVIEVPPPAPSQAPQPYSPMPSETIEYLPSDTPSLSPSKEKSFDPSQAPRKKFGLRIFGFLQSNIASESRKILLPYSLILSFQ